MSAMTTNTASDDTLIRDSQLSGFGAFRERLGLCCCRLLKKSHTYDLSSVSKDTEEVADKPSYVNQAFQREKQARKEKLDKIARTLPAATPNPGGRPPARPLTTVTQGTPRANAGVAQSRPAMSASNSKVAMSSTNRPSPANSKAQPTKKDSNETSSEESSEEESSSDDDQSSDSDRPAAKKAPVKAAAKRR